MLRLQEKYPRAAVAVMAVFSTLFGSDLLTPTTAAATAETVASDSGSSATVPVPATGAYFGAYLKPRSGTTLAARQQATIDMEAQIGRRFDVDRVFFRWNDTLVSDYLKWTTGEGRYALISWNARKRDGSTTTWASIANGDHDAWIDSQADQLRDFASPVIMSFHHEPERATVAKGGDYGTPSEYQAAWRHIVTRFRERGAENVSWMMILVPSTYKSTASPGAGDFYAGDGYIDWIGTDPYNWWTRDGNWRSLQTAAQDFYTWGKARGKPLALAEWGSEEDADTPGRKAQWIQDAAATFRSWPELKLVSYYHSDTAYEWWIDTTPSSLDAFRTMGQDAYFNPRTADTTAPSAPSNLTAKASGARQIDLSWAASTDNVGVAGYHLYRNNSRIATVTITTYSDGTVKPSTRYTYYVQAFDAAGNVSAASTEVTLTSKKK